jgi:DMSO/TMAO reductase YedYZ molybdopterin-dependent catalytic subunit
MYEPTEQRPLDRGDDWHERLRRLSRRGFITGGAAVLGGGAGWHWLTSRSDDDGIAWPLRRVLEFNERVARAAFRSDRLAPSFSRGQARIPRVNGTIGLDLEIDPQHWHLRVVGAAGEQAAQRLTLAEIQALPRVEMTTELKCIEGWSEVVHWAGARLVDLAAITGLASRSGRRFGPEHQPRDLLAYVAVETPDAAYYVGLDMASALHPQTLLCYEMGGEPLSPEHGAPLRLVIPVKYGIKNLKRIGTVRFTDVRPPDYWAQRGYDWYSGH